MLPERDAIATKALGLIREATDALSAVRAANSELASLVRVSGDEVASGTVYVKLALAADFRSLDGLKIELDHVLRADADADDGRGSHPAFRSHALNVLARALPDVLDPAVQTESGAAIDPAFLAN